jgi:hypothetical protein
MFVAASALLVFSCQSASDKLKFDKGRWTEFNDSDGGEYPYRNKMLNDLVSNHKLKGLTYKQLVDSLGAPTYSEASNGTVSYEITSEFDSDIDPTHGKNFDLFLGADSTVISYKISEWKHE